MHLFISAGEPSGDLHGANLIRALKKLDPNIECVGFGGERMQGAGCRLLYPLCQLAVMWFFSVIVNIFRFLRLLRQAETYFREKTPDAVIVIDYPGFHFQLIKRAHALGIPVIWFVPPQLWAWASYRVKKVRRWADHVLCALPFEADWFRAQGCSAEYIGHPYFDELAQRQLDTAFIAAQKAQAGTRIAILPGSRRLEVKRNLSSFLNAAALIHAQRPETRFLIASFNQEQAEMARAMLQATHPTLPAEVHVHRTPEIIHLAECCLAVSGSVSLELMHGEVPTVVLYRLKGRLDVAVGRYMMRVPYISLVNLLANAKIFPEYLTSRDLSPQLASDILHWLDHPEEMAQLREKLRQLHREVAFPGACAKAAQIILERLRHLPGRPAQLGPVGQAA